MSIAVHSAEYPVDRPRRTPCHPHQNIQVPPNDIQGTCHGQVTPRAPAIAKEEVTGHLPRGTPELIELEYNLMAPKEGISPEP